MKTAQFRAIELSRCANLGYSRNIYLNYRLNLRNGGKIRQFSRMKRNGSMVEQAGASRFSNTTMAAMAAAGIGLAGIIFFSQGSSGESATSVPATENSDYIALESRIKDLEKQVAAQQVGAKNKAFVFIKPHAVTDKVEILIKKVFEKRGIKITQSGEISAETIDKDLLIDTHYGAIASKAVKLDPKELNVPEKGLADFEKMSGMSWESAVERNLVKNAKTFCEENDINGDELDEMWSKLKRGVNQIKFGGGFYCGKLKNPKTGDDEYVINGFYMAMRGKFTSPGEKIKYYLVEFYPSSLSWADFRNRVLGGTDPAGAETGSLRRIIYENWKSLGLKEIPNTGDNGVHASASPFEAFAERCNWLKSSATIENDDFGKALLVNDVKKSLVKDFMTDCSVNFDGKKQSIFDLLEDLDSDECLDKAIQVAKAQ